MDRQKCVDIGRGRGRVRRGRGAGVETGRRLRVGQGGKQMKTNVYSKKLKMQHKMQMFKGFLWVSKSPMTR